ncbi:hypothetical protein F8M41_011574 [Gigaspora margarita]|uniref:Uncharacterized protein n=1 Tax=Gigaspora margarita TaxID=4874 RepID=A0A8H4ATN5_GIGMA|nr:hypothetical protein F8M41_011574 [Gigaspora margarita]
MFDIDFTNLPVYGYIFIFIYICTVLFFVYKAIGLLTGSLKDLARIIVGENFQATNLEEENFFTWVQQNIPRRLPTSVTNWLRNRFQGGQQGLPRWTNDRSTPTWRPRE